jgi:hypothetical protein
MWERDIDWLRAAARPVDAAQVLGSLRPDWPLSHSGHGGRGGRRRASSTAEAAG